MSKFALLGQGIGHSLSPILYKELIGEHVQYDLIDVDPTHIPSLNELMQNYEGINITSPYKEVYLKEVSLTPKAQELGAINCLKFKNQKVFGENTDYLAIVDILKNHQHNHPQLKVILLGDGVMSRVTQIALKSLKLNFELFSRKLNSNFHEIDFSKLHDKNDFLLIINTCARSYVFKGPLPEKGIFWDFNYKFQPHIERFTNENFPYEDGFEMLKKQAEYAVAFWSN